MNPTCDAGLPRHDAEASHLVANVSICIALASALCCRHFHIRGIFELNPIVKQGFHGMMQKQATGLICKVQVTVGAGLC